MKLQAVFFDMGGTIETFWYDRDLRLRATPQLARLLAQTGIKLQMSNEALYEVVSAGLHRYHAWRLKSLQELPTELIWKDYIFPQFKIDPEKLSSISEELACWVDKHYYHRQMRPEMPEVLEQIRALGIKIGLISNVSSRSQVPDNLEMYGLRRYFHPIVLSSEYGRRKPDPAIFHHAARLACVPTSQCAYVGDRVTRDIDGARRAGFGLAIQVRHDFDHGEPDVGGAPDAVIDNMRQLVDILAAAVLPSSNAEPACPAAPAIRGLLFDAGDILYYRPNSSRQFSKYISLLGVDPASSPPEIIGQLKRQAYRGLISQDAYFREVLRLYGVTDPEEIGRGMQVLHAEQNDILGIDGVSETLRALKARGFLLGVVTDTATPLHTKLEWFERCGIGDVWDTIIASNDLGICKPDPRIYRAALDQLGLLPEEVLFIGHSASELDGAKAVGITPVAFNYESTAKADYYLQHFSDLASLPLLQPEKIEQR